MTTTTTIAASMNLTAEQTTILNAAVIEAEAARAAGNTPTTASLTEAVMRRGGDARTVRAIECCVSHCFA